MTHIYGYAVYVKEGLPFAGIYLYKTFWILTYVFDWVYFTHCLISFSSIKHLLCLYATVFDSISSNIDEFLSMNTSANVFVFGVFKVHHKDWLTILVELIDLVNSVIVFLSQMTLLRWLTFLLGSLTVILTVLLFWISFFLLMLVFVLQWLSLHCEVLIILLSQFPLTFQQTQTGMLCFIA